MANARLLLASMETRIAAQTARARRVQEAIKVWERHLKTMKGAPAKPKRKAISKTRTKRFTQKARANPGVELDDLIFAGVAAVVEREMRVTLPDAMVGSPYAGDPYVKSPYTTKKHVKSPYKSFDAEFEAEIKRMNGKPARRYVIF